MRQELKDLILNDLGKSEVSQQLENWKQFSSDFEVREFDGEQVVLTWCKCPRLDWRKQEIAFVPYNIQSGQFGRPQGQYHEILSS